MASFPVESKSRAMLCSG